MPPTLGSTAVFPQPKDVKRSGAEVRVGRLVVGRLPASLSGYRDRMVELVDHVAGSPGPPVLPVRFVKMDADPEGYELRIRPAGIRVRAGTSLGALHAMRTLVDLWDSGCGSTLPEIEIVDRPTFAVRGVFVESFAGTDRMDLADWRQFLDRMAQLKFNTVGLSIYGCWDIHHDGERSEYLFTPLEDFPELRSPRRLLTWDPSTASEVEHRYLPRMFDDNLFGPVARYAAGQGIELIPHLGGPGHSTLIPRLLPELSSVDDDGEPTGYGYCVTRPAARNALARLVRCLVRQHLVPNQIRRLHVAADEYYPIRNVDPGDRKRVVSPYCRCSGCRDLTPGDLLMDYLVQIGQVLHEHGISMVHWQDTLVREGVLDDYLDRLESLGIAQPTMAWWKYNDPTPVPDVRRVETWSCPTTGFVPFLFHQDFSPNIETVLRRGRAAGVTGAFAYGVPDPADQMNYALVADLSWNLEFSGGADGFRRRWAQRNCPDDVDAAHHALSTASTITACYPLMMYVVQHLLPYFSTAAAGATTYPDDLVRAFSIAQPPLADVLRQVADTLRDAVASMPPGRDLRCWPNPVATWRRENLRLADSLELFLSVLAVARSPEPTTEVDIAAVSRQAEELLRSVAVSKPAYLAPAALREHWGFVREIEPALRRLREAGGVAGVESWYAWMV